MDTQRENANRFPSIAAVSSAHFTFVTAVLESDDVSAAINAVLELNPSSEVAVLPKQSKAKKRDVNLEEMQRVGIELQSFFFIKENEPGDSNLLTLFF